jgi:hypothetical protein
MVAAIESECWPDSYRNGGRFPAGMVAGFVWNTHNDPRLKISTFTTSVTRLPVVFSKKG